MLEYFEKNSCSEEVKNFMRTFNSEYIVFFFLILTALNTDSIRQIHLPKRSFAFYSETKYYSCTKTVISFSQQNTKFTVVPERRFIFYQEKRSLAFFPDHQSFLLQNTKFVIAPERKFVLWLRNEVRNFSNCFRTPIRLLKTN